MVTSILALALVPGCSRQVGPTDGQVLFQDGSPVQSGSIEFRNTKTKKRFASRIGSDGKFHPVDKRGDPGLPPGEYEVVVVQMVLTEDLALENHTHGGTVPRRYADYYTSGLFKQIRESDFEKEIEIRVQKEEGE